MSEPGELFPSCCGGGGDSGFVIVIQESLLSATPKFMIGAASGVGFWGRLKECSRVLKPK